jgi:hypothetical protein
MLLVILLTLKSESLWKNEREALSNIYIYLYWYPLR